MIASCREGEITQEMRQYIRMCESAKHEIDNISLSPPNAFYYVRDVGILSDSGLQELAGRSSAYDKLLKSPNCIFLPGSEYLNENAFLNQKGDFALNDFLSNDTGLFGYPRGIKPSELFTLNEAGRLAYIMRKQFSKVWDQGNDSWKTIDQISTS